jgi:hypothetical protein
MSTDNYNVVRIERLTEISDSMQPGQLQSLHYGLDYFFLPEVSPEMVQAQSGKGI